MPPVRIVEFTDPGCPWAWSAEPVRRRLSWLYGDAIDWRLRMVGLSASPEEYLDKGFTPERMASSFAQIAHDHHMPIATHVRPRMAATLPACRAIVAARERVGEPGARALLRRLRIRHFGGELLDEPETLAGAAREAPLDPDLLARWCEEDDVERALRDDMVAAREPLPAARVLDYKLADSGAVELGGERRYTCPSYVICRDEDGVRIAVPGFQPFDVYDVVLANLVPDVERREPPEDVAEVLDWAGEPLATQEVAAVCDVSFEEARERLGRVADEAHLGFDGLWTLPRYSRPSSAASTDRASETTASASASAAAS